MPRLSFHSFLFCTLISAAFASSDSVVVFNEIMYHPAGEDEAAGEWVELHNQMAVDIDLSGWRLDGGVEFVFPGGTIIPGGGYLVVAADPAQVPEALGPFSGRLANDGEEIRLVTNGDRLMNAVDYGDGADGIWPVAPDGSGASLAKVEAQSASPDSRQWGASRRVGGTPGAANFTEAESAPLVFNEIAGTDGGGEFRVELYNRGTDPLALEGYVIAVSSGMADDFVFSDVMLETGAFLVVGEDELGFVVAEGERLFLYDSAGDRVLDAAVAEERLRGCFPDGSGTWRYPSALTPGFPNTFAFEESIVINEIMYHQQPQFEEPGEFGPATATPIDAVWRYNDTGSAGADWAREAHLDWPQGQGLFGFTLNPNALPDEIGSDLTVGRTTYFFEMEFDAGENVEGIEVQVRHVIDDGAIFYLNGEEVLRYNMPEGPVDEGTFATERIDDPALSGTIALPSGFVQPGENRLSVEVHQNSFLSADMVFGAEVVTPEVIHPRRAFRASAEEWVELYNRGTEEIDLTGWRLDDAVRYAVPDGITMAPGDYLVVTGDAAGLGEKYPDINIIGNWSGGLSDRTDRMVLVDASGNPADAVEYADGGRWPAAADGGGSSLELRDARADNRRGEAWAASDETGKTSWQTYNYRGVATSSVVGPDNRWNELVLGLLDDGQVLLDDITVTEDPDGNKRPLVRNPGFQRSIFGGTELREWRLLGNHRHGEIVDDPDEPGNNVLLLTTTGSTEHMHNHVETTFASNARIQNGTEYEISFRARWVSGSPQLLTRLYFNRLPRTTILVHPVATGTPGGLNSRAAENTGPTYAEFGHHPVVPAAREDVAISVEAADPDEIAGMTLFWAADGEAFQSLAMADEGDGRYVGVVPGQAAETRVQFYVEGTDSLGAVSAMPARGADSRALFIVDDGLAATNGLHNFRIIMKEADADFLHTDIQLMGNDRLGATVIYREEEIFYDAGVRLKGSERGRVTAPRLGFNVRFGSDHLFRGTHRTVAIDRSEGVGFGQREILINQMMTRAGGVPSEYNDLIQVIAPRSQHTGAAELQLARYGNIFLDSQFESGSDGTLYEYELIYHPTSVNGDGYKRPQPDSVVGTSVRDLGDDKENYRWNYLIKNNRDRDDFTPMRELGRLFSLSGDAFDQRVGAVLDVEQWLRGMAFALLSGAGDQFGANSQHNGMFYGRPDGRILFFPHDMDFAFSASRSITENRELSRIIANPVYRRLYLGHLQDIVNTSHNPTYLQRWADHFGELLPGQNFGAHLSFMTSRTNSVKSQISRAAPSVSFNITSNGGNDFPVSTPRVVLEGSGWINVREIEHVETGRHLEVTWLDFETWRISVPLLAGENRITLQAMDFQGTTGTIFSPVGRDSIVVTNTGDVDAAADTTVVVSELMYHPPAATVAEAAAGFSEGEDFEFVELMNIGSRTVDLAGTAFTDGIAFEFPSGLPVRVEPGALALLVRNRAAFEFRYGAGLPVVGEYPGSRLSNGGEELELAGAGGDVIKDFRYDDRDPWPESADGAGPSLVLIDPATNPDHNDAANWRASAAALGTPGMVEVPEEGGFDVWQEEHFTEAQLEDPSVSGPDADPDGDALSNLLEFALGFNPHNPHHGSATRAGIGEHEIGGQMKDFFEFRYRKNRAAQGVEFVVQISTDLRQWEQADGLVSLGAPSDNGDGTDTISLREAVPVTDIGAGPRYYRLSVAMPVAP